MILSILTNFLCDDLDEDSNEGSIDQCLIKYLTAADGIFPFCTSFPQVRFFLCQPNLRTKPTWFPRLRPLILRLLHHYLGGSPPNLLMLDDFCGELDPDCVHFTILAGVNYVHFVVDQSAELLAKPPTDNVTRLVESFYDQWIQRLTHKEMLYCNLFLHSLDEHHLSRWSTCVYCVSGVRFSFKEP